MPRDVGERLLEDAEERRGQVAVEPRLRQRRSDLAAHARAPLELLGLPLDRRLQTQVVEHARPQLRADAPRARDRVVDQLLHVAQLRQQARLRALGQVATQPGHVHAQRGQGLAQLVVDLAGDARTLLLAHPLEVRAQVTELLARAAQLLLGPPPLGHVYGDAEQLGRAPLAAAHARHVAHPQHAAVGGDHAVLDLVVAALGRRAPAHRGHPFAVVRVHVVAPERRLLQPLRQRIAQQRLRLVAHEPELHGGRVGAPDDGLHRLHELPVLGLGAPQRHLLLAALGDVLAGPDHGHRGAALVADDLRPRLQLPHRAVRPHDALLHGEAGALRHRVAHGGLDPLAVVGMDAVEEVAEAQVAHPLGQAVDAAQLVRPHEGTVADVPFEAAQARELLGHGQLALLARGVGLEQPPLADVHGRPDDPGHAAVLLFGQQRDFEDAELPGGGGNAQVEGDGRVTGQRASERFRSARTVVGVDDVEQRPAQPLMGGPPGDGLERAVQEAQVSLVGEAEHDVARALDELPVAALRFAERAFRRQRRWQIAQSPLGALARLA